MALRNTKEIRYVRLAEERIREIEALVSNWPIESKAFMRARLNQYTPRSNPLTSIMQLVTGSFWPSKEKRFAILKDPEILTDWQRRLSISGRTNPLEAWNKILEKEVSAKDYVYLTHLLDEELTDVHVPHELEALFEKIYKAYVRKEYMSDSDLPKAPLLLVIGPSGSGKTATVSQTIENVIFGNQVLPEIDMEHKKEELLSDLPFWKSIDDIDQDLSNEIARRKKLLFYKRLSKTPLLNILLKKRISHNLFELEEQSLEVDYAVVTPNDYQTALAGEPGNYFKNAMGDPKQTAIRHVEEAQSAFGKAEGGQNGVERQQRSLIDTSNIIIDEIISGRRDCLLIATTDQPERIDPAIYRRFVEKGRIIDMSEFWQAPDNLKEIVRLELMQKDLALCAPSPTSHTPAAPLEACDDFDKAVESIYAIFNERSLKVTPAYVRKLIGSIVDIKGAFEQSYLEEPLLVRKAFEFVARNSYGDLFKKLVNKMDRRVSWEEYVGDIKDTYSEMANNCLYYGVSEEKGVVLNGPPGSGKTFLVKSWLSENREVNDISASPSRLQDPTNPIDGAVNNLEKIYDIAKMIAPTIIFFDEGDALAPRRSPSGGSPSDRLTNKLLSLLDGDVPLNRVFTVLTTNRLDILDPALIRSKRLKVMEVAGHLGKKDIYKIVQGMLENVPLGKGLDTPTLTDSAKGICNTPADYVAFVEKVLALRKTEFEVLQRFEHHLKSPGDIKKSFIKLNSKTLLGILDAVEIPQSIRSEVSENSQKFLQHYQTIENHLRRFDDLSKYPVVPSHLQSARQEIARNPVKKGKVQLDEFLEAELSQEPQVGFIVGVGANDVAGMLLPIATSLTYRGDAEKIIVTGAVASSSAAAAELDMAVQMTQQSAKEALTMVENYLQRLLPEVNIARLVGEFYHPYSLHHQLLSASYNVGGPSAGYALAINTLSALLQLPVCNDFGITGAPWTKGTKSSEVGGSVIIGGHTKKAEKVLLHLKRMYMPQKNYDDLQHEYLANYWRQNKDIVGVVHFGDLVPEVLWLGDDYGEQISQLLDLRIQQKLSRYRGQRIENDFLKRVSNAKRALKHHLEGEIRLRLESIRTYLQDSERDPHVSMAEIFRHRHTTATT
jgi:SpoVK/Ycf46/Vps4 family AAA+-type ATPase